MRKLNLRLAMTFLMAGLGGGAMVLQTSTPSLAQPERVREAERREGWQHHDGRWNYWHPGDNRWYHTDVAHWYYHDGRAWQLYRFDQGFGHQGFERGRYAAPNEGYAVPRHGVYRP